MSLSGNTYGYDFTNDVYQQISEIFAEDILQNPNYDFDDLVDMIEHVDNGDLVFDNMVRNYINGYIDAIADYIYDIIAQRV